MSSLSTSNKLKYCKRKILKDILCKNYVAVVVKSSIKLTVGRTLSRVGKSKVGDGLNRSASEPKQPAKPTATDPLHSFSPRASTPTPSAQATQ